MAMRERCTSTARGRRAPRRLPEFSRLAGKDRWRDSSWNWRKSGPGCDGMKIGFVSLGCPKNLVDSEVMMGQLVAKGHELTPHPDQADVLVVNTCSFIDPAKKESVDTILEMAEYKKIGRAKKLIVAGCLVERYRGDIRDEMPEVDAIVGTNELETIVALCEGLAGETAGLTP